MAQKKRVVHKPVPQEAKNEMPKAPHVFLRGSVFYVRKRVPTELVPVMGAQEIKVSLKTSDRKKAIAEAPYALVQLAAQFDKARRGLVPKVATSRTAIKELADSEIHRIVAGYFIAEEKRNETWWITEGQKWPHADLETAWDNLTGDISHYQTVREKSGTGFGTPAFDASGMAKLCLEEAGIELPPDSPSFAKLGELLRRALVETTARQIDRLRPYVGCGDVRPRGDSYFESLTGATSEPRKKHTLGNLIEEFQAYLAKKRTGGTQRTYSVPIRLLLQHFGDGHPLSSIGPKQIGDLFDLLEQVPRNAQQRYPKKSLQEAVAAADKNKDPDRLAKKTLTNYHRNIIAMFNYGKAMGMVSENPAASPIHRDRFKGKREKKELFDTATLNQLFQAPLYKGCQNDGEGYAKPGPNVIRRGRFWVPLLGLYQGFRCNEACQLHTADIKQEDGVWYIWVREEADQKTQTDKSVKNVNSERPVPIHKELIRFGFLDFVADRAKDKKGPNLFPELPPSAKGYRSDLFSKWFGRFKDKVAKDCPATFHSFRHHWRTALRRANVSTEDAEELGGWSSGSRSSEHTYNHGKTLLALKAVIDLVEYPGLDLSHLVLQAERQEPLKTYPRRSRVSV